MKAWIGRTLCYVGLHDWKPYRRLRVFRCRRCRECAAMWIA